MHFPGLHVLVRHNWPVSHAKVTLILWEWISRYKYISSLKMSLFFCNNYYVHTTNSARHERAWVEPARKSYKDLKKQHPVYHVAVTGQCLTILSNNINYCPVTATWLPEVPTKESYCTWNTECRTSTETPPTGYVAVSPVQKTRYSQL